MLLFSTLAALSFNTYIFILFLFTRRLSSGGEVLTYTGYVGMRCPKGYGLLRDRLRKSEFGSRIGYPFQETDQFVEAFGLD